MGVFEFLAYADIHHDEYKNGITLQDTIDVENQITEYALDHGIKYVFFAGDWFRATNPLQRVIKSAEASWKKRSDCGVTTIAIPGNHDRETKLATSSHAFEAVNIFNNDMKNVFVYGNVHTINIGGVNFVLIPSGHSNLEISKPANDCPTVVVFHDMVAGSYLSSGMASESGIKPDIINNLNPVCALGGDNHTPQNINNVITNGLYLGAPLQHTWGDSGQNRGFYHIKIDGDRAVVNKCITRSPKFVKMVISAASSELDVLLNIMSELPKVTGGSEGIIEVTIVGRESKNYDTDFIERKIIESGARRARVIVDRSLNRTGFTPSTLTKPEDKWTAYLSLPNLAGMNDLDVTLLSEIGKWAIDEARKTP